MDFQKTAITESFFQIESYRGTCLVPLVLFLNINVSSFSKDQKSAGIWSPLMLLFFTKAQYHDVFATSFL